MLGLYIGYFRTTSNSKFIFLNQNYTKCEKLNKLIFTKINLTFIQDYYFKLLLSSKNITSGSHQYFIRYKTKKTSYVK